MCACAAAAFLPVPLCTTAGAAPGTTRFSGALCGGATPSEGLEGAVACPLSLGEAEAEPTTLYPFVWA